MVARSGAVKPQDAEGLLAAEPAALDGNAQAQTLARVQATVGAIFKENIAKSFSLAYYAAALMAYIAVIPALMTGRRVGEHKGHHERAIRDRRRRPQRSRRKEPRA